jgi:hypothetical protein
MSSLSSPRKKSGRPTRWAGTGTVVLALVFLVALVFAANHNDVLGWVLAVTAFGWLVLSTVVYIGVHKAAQFGASQVRQAQASLASATGSVTSSRGRSGASAGTTVVEEAPSSGVRDIKLEHSFKIIEVQARVITEGLAAGEAGRERVERALETIAITASNGRGMLRPDADDAVPGVVVD